MAWSATDNAESYANGNSINGLNGGSGFDAAWAEEGAQTKQISNTPTLQGSLCFMLDKNGANANPGVGRTFTGITSGSVTWIGRVSSNTTNTTRFVFQPSDQSANYFTIVMDGAGTMATAGRISSANGAGWTNLQAFNANQNYTFVVDFDCATDTYTVSIDGGAPSAAQSFATVATTVSRIRFTVETSGVNAYQVYFDDVKPYTAPAAGGLHLLTLMGVGN